MKLVVDMMSWTSYQYQPTRTSHPEGRIITLETASVSNGSMGQANVWTGSAWSLKPVKVWTGATWYTSNTKFWNGSTWVAS